MGEEEVARTLVQIPLCKARQDLYSYLIQGGFMNARELGQKLISGLHVDNQINESNIEVKFIGDAEKIEGFVSIPVEGKVQVLEVTVRNLGVVG